MQEGKEGTRGKERDKTGGGHLRTYIYMCVICVCACACACVCVCMYVCM